MLNLLPCSLDMLAHHVLTYFLYRMLEGGEGLESDWEHCFQRCHQIALNALDTVRTPPQALDSALSATNLYAVALQARKLSTAPTLGEPSIEGALDVQKPCVIELEMLVTPVIALKTRLEELLDQWPQNPLLEQLTAICKRLLGAPR